MFVGYGINAPERGWNDYAGRRCEGQDRRHPGQRSRLADDRRSTGPFDGRAMTYYGRWTYKYEEAARQGAAAAIIVHDTEPAAYGWGVVQSSWTGPQLELDAQGRPYGPERRRSAGSSIAAAEALFASAGKDFAALVAAAKAQGLQGGAARAEGVGRRFDNTIRRQASKNVIGILPGTERPDEYVLYIGALGSSRPLRRRSTATTSATARVDNASGRRRAGRARRGAGQGRAGRTRSIVFLAVTAEESGLLGSRILCRAPGLSARARRSAG